MKRDVFPIGFWNYIGLSQTDPNALRDWSELGMTLIQGPHFTEDCDAQVMLALLDDCAARGIRVIFRDGRAYAHGASEDPQAYEARFREAYEQFGHHPAVMGFFVGDEPWEERAILDCVTAHEIQIKVAPELTPYLNFVSYFEGSAPMLMKKLTGKEHPNAEYADWARALTARHGLRILSYDCYSQMNPRAEGVDSYFLNLRTFTEAARAAGCEAWTTLLSVGHFRYRCPTEDDLRWQLSTAVACGMKGILWFYIRHDMPGSNYRNPPINEFGERTETFAWLSRVNRQFIHQYGRFFARATHCATYLVGRAWGGYAPFVPYASDADAVNITSVQGLDAVAGFFELGGERYLALVNNSWEESGEFRVHVRAGARLERMNWMGVFESVKIACHDAHYSETAEEWIGGDFLAPGQMKIYRL